MKSARTIVTPKMIWLHNVRCLGRFFLWGSGAAAVFLILFLLGWLLTEILTGARELTGLVALASGVFASGLFVIGWRHLRRKGEIDWDRIAQKANQSSGMRISSRGDFGNAEMTGAAFQLFLCGPDWLRRMHEEIKGFVSPNQQTAERLERLRRHLAARDSWVPLEDFPEHQEDLYLLARLDILSIREMATHFYFHVTVKGATQWSETENVHPVN